MQLTQRMLKKVNIFTNRIAESGYVGKKNVPELIGFVYAEVFPDKESVSDERSGVKQNGGTTLILRREAGVACGDLAGIFGEKPDSRVLEVRRCPGHITVRTELL